MYKLWDTEEEELLELFLSQGMTHKEIANELDRTTVSVQVKSTRLGLRSCSTMTGKSMEHYILELPTDIVVLEDYINTHTKILHKHTCGYEWKVEPNSILSGYSCPRCAGNKKKSTEEYAIELSSDITILGEYINSKTKILHRHSCGYEWKAMPNHILRGRSCPKCAKNGFNPDKPAQLYIIDFGNNIYKVGVSKDITRRMEEFGIPSKVVYIREFETGAEALLKEKEYLSNVKDYLSNTGRLKSGNTETFIFK